MRSKRSYLNVKTCLRLTVILGVITALACPAFAQQAATGKKRLPADLSSAIVQVAKQAIPAVVHIDVMERQEVQNPAFPFENDPFFRYFFGNPKGPKKFKRELRGVGTGMLIDTQGHILTNHHVAGGATKIEVSLSDGRKFAAKLVGSDPKTDLAVVRITSKEAFPHIAFGDSDRMEVGEWVVAIGHPRGLDQTVTQGIISAKHRRGITDPTSYQDFLQTDAAINPGNSGGPLLNLYGEVIGVNTAIASQSGGSEGIGFAIPSNMALHISKTLIRQGRVERGWLGIAVQDLNPDLAKSLGIAATKGAVVNDVVKGGPAERAGLRKSDVVIGFGTNEIRDGATLRNLAAMTPIGQDVKVVALRQGKKQDFLVKIGNLKEAVRQTSGTIKERLGAEVRAVTAKEAEKFGLDPKQGVALASVDPKGPLGAAKFEAGDMLLEINGRPITGLDSFVEIAGLLKPRQRVTLLALDFRTGSTGTIQIVTK